MSEDLPDRRASAPYATRWESYRGVQVQVPADWGYGVPGKAWCGALRDPDRVGAVGRPGPMDLPLCPSEYPPVGWRENWFTFDSREEEGIRRFDHGWVEETRRLDGVYLTIFTDDDTLRATILASAQPIDGTDHYGCFSDHPVVGDPGGYRPSDGGLPAADAVESVSVCQYELPRGSAPPLMSSGRITGAAAKELVAAIWAAPEGAGSGGDEYEIVVLRIHTADGAREVVVRYAGESGNGFDDGVTVRRLTADALRPLLTGGNIRARLPMPVADLLGWVRRGDHRGMDG